MSQTQGAVGHTSVPVPSASSPRRPAVLVLAVGALALLVGRLPYLVPDSGSLDLSLWVLSPALWVIAVLVVARLATSRRLAGVAGAVAGAALLLGLVGDEMVRPHPMYGGPSWQLVLMVVTGAAVVGAILGLAAWLATHAQRRLAVVGAVLLAAAAVAPLFVWWSGVTQGEASSTSMAIASLQAVVALVLVAVAVRRPRLLSSA